MSYVAGLGKEMYIRAVNSTTNMLGSLCIEYSLFIDRNVEAIPVKARLTYSQLADASFMSLITARASVDDLLFQSE